jgi:hypothetical protein
MSGALQVLAPVQEPNSSLAAANLSLPALSNISQINSSSSSTTIFEQHVGVAALPAFGEPTGISIEIEESAGEIGGFAGSTWVGFADYEDVRVAADGFVGGGAGDCYGNCFGGVGSVVIPEQLVPSNDDSNNNNNNNNNNASLLTNATLEGNGSGSGIETGFGTGFGPVVRSTKTAEKVKKTRTTSAEMAKETDGRVVHLGLLVAMLGVLSLIV